MKIKYLIPFILIFALFSPQTWAPPTSKPQGKKEKEEVSRELAKPEEDESALGAVGGARALGIDLSKCEIDPRKQRKLRVKGRDGKEHHVCKGAAVCAGKTVPVTCKISAAEASCPQRTKECIRFEFPSVAAKCEAFLSLIGFKPFSKYQDSTLYIGPGNKPGEYVSFATTNACCQESGGVVLPPSKVALDLDLIERPEGALSVIGGYLRIDEYAFHLIVADPNPGSVNAEIIVNKDQYSIILRGTTHEIRSENSIGRYYQTLRAGSWLRCERQSGVK